ncbi:MAG: phosphocholine cytidylyltransferase family protein [Deltaproteobacteria bacterium]|nr:phosphocholine cytidylyltransferase family protein [Deltaproteobacteria bacterium]
MKTIILSAGQGKRLLPLTAETPKCLLSVQKKTLIEWQIDALRQCGVDKIIVVTGYRGEKVEAVLQRSYGPVRTLYNPAYATTDNLVSCWAARHEMDEDFILLNGDTLFETDVLKRLFKSPDRPVTVVVDHKELYDADDMKVAMEGRRLLRIGKNIAHDKVQGESIGMILFRGAGPMLFRNALKKALGDAAAGGKWYLSVIDEMARIMPVWTCSITGLRWCEVDYPADLEQADRVVSDGYGKESGMARDY